jgi:hypothetical protein
VVDCKLYRNWAHACATHGLTHSQVPGWTHLRVHQNVVAESWDSEGAPDFQHYKGVEGRARSPGIRLGRGTRRSSLTLHPKQTTKWLVHIREHPWVLGQATGTLDHKIHHGPNSGGVTTIFPIVFSVPLHRTCTRMALFPGTPKLESRNCPETVPVGVLGLWELITPDCKVWSRPSLNQTCSPRSRSFQRRIALSIRKSGRGRFPTFSGRESNCQFDSQPFFCP